MYRVLLLLVVLSLAACSSLKSPAESFAETVKKMEGPKVDSLQETQAKQAKESVEKRDYVKALTIYNQLVADHPDNRAYQLGLADSLRLKGEVAKAQDVYSKLVDASKTGDKDWLDAMEGRGLSHVQQGNFDEAVKAFTLVLNQDGTRWRSINGLAVALALTGRSKEAMEYYKVALQLSNNNVAVLNNMGLSLAFEGKVKQAYAPLEQASNSLAKGSAERQQVDLNLALVYGLGGRTTAAEKTLKPYLVQAAIYNNLGVYAMLANDKAEAQKYLKKALSSSPTHYQRAWENLQKLGG